MKSASNLSLEQTFASTDGCSSTWPSNLSLPITGIQIQINLMVWVAFDSVQIAKGTLGSQERAYAQQQSIKMEGSCSGSQESGLKDRGFVWGLKMFQRFGEQWGFQSSICGAASSWNSPKWWRALSSSSSWFTHTELCTVLSASCVLTTTTVGSRYYYDTNFLPEMVRHRRLNDLQSHTDDRWSAQPSLVPDFGKMQIQKTKTNTITF